MAVTQSDISRLESELRSIENENSQMRGEINQMTSTLNSALNSVRTAQSNAVHALDTGHTTLNSGDGTLKNVSAVADDIGAITARFKIIENSYKEIRKLKNDLRNQQGNEKTVKRMVTAIIENEENKLASEEVIDVQSEKLHIMTKDFFLSYIMMDLQLTKRGEAEAAERARKAALDLNPRKSAWVYFAVALRRNDEESMRHWFEKLTVRPISGGEKEQFKMLTLLALTDIGKFGEQLKKYIGLNSVGEIEGENRTGKLLDTYRGLMTVKPPEFRYMNESIEEAGNLSQALYGAMNNEEIAGYLQKFNKKAQSDYKKEVIIKLFDITVDDCNSPRSQEIYDKIADHERIIERKGDVESAMELKVRQKAESVSDVDLEDCLFEWLGENENYAGKEKLKEYSYSKCRRAYKRAYKKYVSEYRSKYTESVTLNLGEYRTRTLLNDISKEEEDIKTFCAKRRDAEKAKLSDLKFILCMVFGGILAVAGIVLFCLSGIIGNAGAYAGLIGCELAGVVLFVLGVGVKYNNFKARIASDEKYEKDIVSYTEKMRYVFNEMQSYREMYAQFDGKALKDNFF